MEDEGSAADQCTACDEGKASSATAAASSTTCVDCERGSVAPDAAMSSCDDCEAGRFMEEEGSAADECNACPAGRFFGEEAGVSVTSCEECGSLTSYCPEGSARPVPVSDGHYVTGGGEYTRTSQEPCPPGTYCLAGSQLPCAEGFAQPEEGQTSCVACPSGRFQNVTGQTECHTCTASSFCPAGSTAPFSCTNGFSAAGAGSCSACSVCPAGTKIVKNCTSEDDQVCEACAAGRYSNINNATACLGCPEGYFCPKRSSSPIPCGSTALYCPAGSSVGASVSDGNYSTPEDAPIGLRTGQAPCPQGSKCVGGVKSECASGTMQSLPGQSNCNACAVCAPGTRVAAQCTTVSDEGTCDTCEAGRFSDEAGASDCKLCPQGHYCAAGAREAAPCARGSFQDETGLSSCKLCSGGRFQNATGQTRCLECSEGHFCAEGAIAEVKCSDSVLVACPSGSAEPVILVLGTYLDVQRSVTGETRLSGFSNDTITPGVQETYREALAETIGTTLDAVELRVADPDADSGEEGGHVGQDGRKLRRLVEEDGILLEYTIRAAAAPEEGDGGGEEGGNGDGSMTAEEITAALEASIAEDSASLTLAFVEMLRSDPPGDLPPSVDLSTVGAAIDSNVEVVEEEVTLQAQPGSYVENGMLHSCPPGTFCAGGEQPQQSCAPGTYSNRTGAAACDQCTIGRYQDAQRAESCVDCPRDSTTASAGAFTADQCKCLFGIEVSSREGSSSNQSACGCPRSEYADEAELAAAREAPSTDLNAYGDVCKQCPDGAACTSDGIVLGLLPLEEGYWRARNESPVVLPCNVPGACLGGAVVADALCREGHRGPYCEICDAGFYRDAASGLCEDCAGSNAHATFAGTVVGLLIVVGLSVFCLARKTAGKRRRPVEAPFSPPRAGSRTLRNDSVGSMGEIPEHDVIDDDGDHNDNDDEESAHGAGRAGGERKDDPRFSLTGADKQRIYSSMRALSFSDAEAFGGMGQRMETVNNAQSQSAEMISYLKHLRLREAFRSMKTKLKVCVSFLQMEKIVRLNFALPLPEAFLQFLAIFDVNLSVFSGVSGDCIFPMNYYTGLVANTAGPLIVLTALALLYRYAAGTGRSTLAERVAYLMLLITFSVLPSATTLSIFTLVCDRLDYDNPPGVDEEDPSFLVMDYSIECYTPEHRSASYYSFVMILVYPIGIPLAYLYLLLRRSDGLSVPQILWRARRVQRHKQHLEGLVHEEDLAKARNVSVEQLLADDDTLQDDSLRRTLEAQKPRASLSRSGGKLDRRYKGFMLRVKEFMNLRNDRGALAVALDGEKASKCDSRIRSLSFLLESYQPEFWWFEIFESFRRMVLTAIPVFFTRGTVGQQAIGILLSAGFTLFFFVFRPYVTANENNLAGCAQGLIFLIIVYGLCETASSSTIGDSGDDKIGQVLILMNVVVLAITTYSAAVPAVALAKESRTHGATAVAVVKRMSMRYTQAPVAEDGSLAGGRDAGIASDGTSAAAPASPSLSSALRRFGPASLRLGRPGTKKGRQGPEHRVIR